VLDRSKAGSLLARDRSDPSGPVRLAALAAAFWAVCLLNELAEGTPTGRVCKCSKSACRAPNLAGLRHASWLNFTFRTRVLLGTEAHDIRIP
jgi:hypothetical protein